MSALALKPLRNKALDAVMDVWRDAAPLAPPDYVVGCINPQASAYVMVRGLSGNRGRPAGRSGR